MAPPPNGKARSILLQERDHVVLQCIKRYHVITHEALLRLPVFLDDKASLFTVKNVTTRLRQAGLIRSYPLFGRRTYDQLTAAGSALCGAHPKYGQPLPPQAKARAYAVMVFCCLGDTPRHKFTAEEFQTNFSEIARPGEPVDYYIDVDAEGNKRLGFIKVDHARSGHFHRVFHGLKLAIAKRCTKATYRTLIKQDRFVISLLTATATKAEKLRQELPAASIGARINVHVIPDLVHLVAPQRFPFTKPHGPTTNA